MVNVPNYYEPVEAECIFNLVPPTEQPEPRPPMYVSKAAPEPASSFGKAKGQHANFGKKAGSYKPSPANFVKTNQSNKVDSLSAMKKTSPEKVARTSRHAPVGLSVSNLFDHQNIAISSISNPNSNTVFDWIDRLNIFHHSDFQNFVES